MALNFKNIKDPKLGLLDTITFGKLKDCRVCDVIQDHYEYLIWAEKQGYIKFQQIVIETIQETAHFEKWVKPTEIEKTDTYLKNKMIAGHYVFDESEWDNDVPF